MIEFPGEVRKHPELGELWLPMVDITVEHGGQMMVVRMIADSGAFLTLIPLTVGLRLGLAAEPQDTLHSGQGAGASTVPYLLRRVDMRIGRYVIPVRLGWVQNDLTPPLLGRVDVFEEFHIEFRQSERRTIFRKRRRSRSACL